MDARSCLGRILRAARRRSVGVAASVLALAAVAAGAEPAVASDPPVAGTLDLLRPTFQGSTARGWDQRFYERADEGAGGAVAFPGDFNGDGHEDFAIGMPGTGSGGTVAIVYGPPAIGRTVRIPTARTRGVRIVGPAGSRAGTSLAAPGDLNGDGFDDLIIGAPRDAVMNRGRPGAAYVVFGGSHAAGHILLSSLGTVGRRIAGVASGDFTGGSLATTGDLDGDGSREVVIGAENAAGQGRADAGGAFVVYSSSLEADVDLADLAAGGYRIDGAAPGDDTGRAVSGVADMNGDLRPEVIVGAPSATGNSGAVHVVWGLPPAAAARVDLAALGTGGSTLTGAAGELAGASVAGLDDITGDGRPDVAVGAPLAGPNGRSRSGAAYLVPGRFDTGTAALPAGGRIVGGGDRGETLGRTVAPAGDVDRDGTSDVLIGLGAESALRRRGAGAVVVLLTGRLRPGDVDGALFGYTGMRLAGPTPGSGTGRAVAGGVDVDSDGRPDVLLGQPGRGRRAGTLVLAPAPPTAPSNPERTGDVKATNVEVIVDDSGSMARIDRGGLLRRQALERMLVDPAAQDRVLGAVEFGTSAHQIFPPIRIGEAAIAGDRLEVLRRLLAERIADSGGRTDLAAGVAAGSLSNPAAQARIVVVDPRDVREFPGFGPVRTDVIGIGAGASRGRARLEQAASDSGGDFYAVTDGGELQSALAAIDAELRGEPPLATAVEEAKGVAEVDPAVPGEAAAAVSRRAATVAFAATATAKKARSLRRARMVTTWDRGNSRFKVSGLRFRLGSARVKVTRPQLRRALRGRWQKVRRGLQIRGRTGKTFVVLSVRGLDRAIAGRRARAAALGFAAYSVFTRTRGSRRTVARSRWTYQKRPT